MDKKSILIQTRETHNDMKKRHQVFKKKIDMYIRPYNHQCTNQSMHVRIMAEMVENVGGDGGAVTETAENGCGDDGKRRRKRHR